MVKAFTAQVWELVTFPWLPHILSFPDHHLLTPAGCNLDLKRRLRADPELIAVWDEDAYGTVSLDNGPF